MDAAIVILTPQTMTDVNEIAREVVESARSSDKPIFASFMGGVDVASGVDLLRRSGIPHYPFPENAARVLRAMTRYRTWITRPQTNERIFDVDRREAHRIVERVLEEGRNHLLEPEAHAVLAAYGLPVLESGLARTREDLPDICSRIGFPLVMKVVSPDILHKTDVGGVVLDVRDLQSAQTTFDRITTAARREAPHADIRGVLLQRQVPEGREVIIGAVRDDKFGSLVMFGLGGIYAEVLNDVVFRLAPIRTLSARHMIEEIRARRILEGVRGAQPVDFDALTESLERLSQLVVEFPAIQELDINPVIAYPDHVVVVDARIVLGEKDPGGPHGA